MNKNILKLEKIAAKKSRLIIGLMSGTSMDGLDVALCKFENAGLNTKCKLVAFETVPYSSETKERIAAVFAQKDVILKAMYTTSMDRVAHGRIVK